MFGETIDYHILRPFTHGRNRATEVELNERARYSTYSLEEASKYLKKVKQVYFGGLFPIDPDISYLDIGCGMGRLSIGLSLAGAKNVTGIDIIARNIDEAKNISENLTNNSRPDFIHSDVHEWNSDRKFDVVIVLGAMEHIHDPASFLKMLARLIKPEGRAFVSFEPFQGPIGDHMSHFFWLPIPWRGILFSEKAIMRLRREKFRPTDPVERYKDVQGGLNQMWYEDYIRYVHEAGLEFVKHNCNPQLRYRFRYLPFHLISKFLTSIPKIRGFFIVSDYSILKHGE